MITSQEMRKLEHDAVQRGISIEKLMENAGKEVYLAAKEKYDLDGKNVVIFCGQGNNAGDGFVAARYFAKECQTLILFFGDKGKLGEEAEENYRKVEKKINIIKIDSKEDLKQFHFQEDLDFIFVDALLGTGVKGSIREPISYAIDYFNSLKGDKVAVDIPSGMDPDTGECEKACEVDLIVCFHDLKQGLEKMKDKVVVVDIGINDSVIKKA